MKILMVCQYYTPEPFRHPDICEALVKRGHEVTAVVGVPNYPMGQVYPGYAHGGKRDEILNGVRVHRCATVARRKGIVFRMLNYYSYAISASLHLMLTREKYDVIFVNQLSPVMMAQPAIRFAKKHGTPIVLYCLDLWPESLLAGGVGRENPLYRFFDGISRRIYQRADRILATSRSFSDYFAERFGIRDVTYLPQYAEELFRPEDCCKTPDGFTDLMFAGNVGTAQSVDTILRAAALTQDIPQLRWHIVGDGSELLRMQKEAEGLSNVIFHGRRPLEEMPKFYSMADAMLVTLERDPVLSLTLPGKVQTYLAAGKPVIGAIDGETPKILAEAACGLCGAAEDAEALAENARRFLTADSVSMGQNAREYYETHFRKERFIDALEAALQEQCDRKQK